MAEANYVLERLKLLEARVAALEAANKKAETPIKESRPADWYKYPERYPSTDWWYG